MRALVLVIVSSVSSAAVAAPRPARDTADVGNTGSYSVGIFDPLRIALNDRLELEAHPLVFFVAPHLDVRLAVIKPTVEPGAPPSGIRLTYELGLAMPTWAMRLMKGYFFPTWSLTPNDIGYMLIPRFALVMSGDVITNDVYTARVDVAVRWPLGLNSAAPLDSPLAPLNLLLAAPLTGFCGRVGGAYDHAFGEVLRLRGEVNLYLTGSQTVLLVNGANVGIVGATSPFIFTAHLGLDIAVFKQSRITVGVLYANFDQGATQVVTGVDGFSRRERVRSNNVLPTLDFIWAGL